MRTEPVTRPLLFGAAGDLMLLVFGAASSRAVGVVAEGGRPVVPAACALVAASMFALAGRPAHDPSDVRTRRQWRRWRWMRLAGALACALWLCPGAGLLTTLFVGATLLLARRTAGRYHRASDDDHAVRTSGVRALRAAFERPLSFLAGGAAAPFEEQLRRGFDREERLVQARLRAALRFDLLREAAVAGVAGCLLAAVCYLLAPFAAGVDHRTEKSFALFLTTIVIVRTQKETLADFIQ